MSWEFDFGQWHTASGLVFFFVGTLLVIGGLVTLKMREKNDFKWQTKRMLRFSAVHKYFGWLIIFTVQIAVVSGILVRISIGNNDQPKKVLLVGGNIALFLLTIGIGECCYRRRRRSVFLTTPSKYIQNRMDRYELE